MSPCSPSDRHGLHLHCNVFSRLATSEKSCLSSHRYLSAVRCMNHGSRFYEVLGYSQLWPPLLQARKSTRQRVILRSSSRNLNPNSPSVCQSFSAHNNSINKVVKWIIYTTFNILYDYTTSPYCLKRDTANQALCSVLGEAFSCIWLTRHFLFSEYFLSSIGGVWRNIADLTRAFYDLYHYSL